MGAEVFDAKARAENEEIDWRWEGRWASRETEHDKPWPWPRAEDCARWSGQVEFLQELQAAEARVGGARPWGKGFDSCRLCDRWPRYVKLPTGDDDWACAVGYAGTPNKTCTKARLRSALQGFFKN